MKQIKLAGILDQNSNISEQNKSLFKILVGYKNPWRSVHSPKRRILIVYKFSTKFKKKTHFTA